ncbi:MAG: hypothetical protein U1F15_02095 [Burkholderiales bacterium]
MLSDAAGAWVLTISSGPKAAFLQVGNGSYSGTYQSGGTPLNNATVNTVSVTVPASAVGRGTAQQMTSDSTQSASFYDNFAVCNPPSQVYVGGWVRTPTGSGSGVLSVTSPAALTSATSPATIPFTQISWTSTANGSTTPDIPAGTFTGGTQALRTIAAGTWVENCHTFFYANTAIVSAATYTGQVTYTLVLP